MRALPFFLLAWITMLAPAPASAQRFNGNYPVCMQRWEWGGGSWITCEFSSWEACRAMTVGLSAMCLQNPYVQPSSPPVHGPRYR
jgi:hypothetical protein